MNEVIFDRRSTPGTIVDSPFEGEVRITSAEDVESDLVVTKARDGDSYDVTVAEQGGAPITAGENCEPAVVSSVVCPVTRFRILYMEMADGAERVDGSGLAKNTLFSVVGDGGDDEFAAGKGRAAIFGGMGNDTIEGHPGGRGTRTGLWEGGFGADDILAPGGPAEILGGAGADSLTAQGAGDFLFGNGGSDVITGAESGDRLRGARSDDVLRGEAGPDVLTAGGGADDLFGGPGNDVLRIGRDGQEDTVHCGPGHDIVESRGVEGDRLFECEQVVAELPRAARASRGA